jgi:hypothetical protein
MEARIVASGMVIPRKATPSRTVFPRAPQKIELENSLPK